MKSFPHIDCVILWVSGCIPIRHWKISTFEPCQNLDWSGSPAISGRQNLFGVFHPGQSCVRSLHLLTLFHCCLQYTAGPPRPRQDPDIIRATGKSGAEPYRHVGVATVMETLAEQCESNLDSRLQRVNCTKYQQVSRNMHPYFQTTCSCWNFSDQR